MEVAAITGHKDLEDAAEVDGIINYYPADDFPPQDLAEVKTLRMEVGIV